MQLTQTPIPGNRIRFSLKSERLGSQPFILHVEDKAARAENTLTTAIIGVLTHRIDRFVASAMDILPAQRHERQDAVYDKCMGLVNFLTGVLGGPFSCAECSRAMQATLPLLYCLRGVPDSAGYVARAVEYDALTSLAEVVKARVVANGTPSCHRCFMPTPCTCKHN